MSEPITAPPISTNEQALAAMGLVNQALAEGKAMTIAAAALQIVQGGGDLTPYRALIDAERARQQANADRAAQVAFEQSPEGYEARAAAQIAEREALAARRPLAEELAMFDHGIDADSLADISTEELLVMTGLVPPSEPADTLASNLASLNDDDRAFIESGGEV